MEFLHYYVIFVGLILLAMAYFLIEGHVARKNILRVLRTDTRRRLTSQEIIQAASSWAVRGNVYAYLKELTREGRVQTSGNLWASLSKDSRQTMLFWAT